MADQSGKLVRSFFMKLDLTRTNPKRLVALRIDLGRCLQPDADGDPDEQTWRHVDDYTAKSGGELPHNQAQ